MTNRRSKFLRVIGIMAVTAVVLAVGTVAAGALWLQRALDPSREAIGEIERVAEELKEDLGWRERLREAEHVAATEVPTGPRGNAGIRTTPVAWSGRIYSDETATIDVRFEVTSGDYAAVSRCYRYTMRLYRYTEHREVDCPSGNAPGVPSPAPILTLPADAEERLAGALRAATPESLAREVRARFPDGGIGVDTVVHQGVLVAAVGVAAERDCVAMIRKPDGTVTPVAFSRVQLEPGETGCSTALYTHPVR